MIPSAGHGTGGLVGIQPCYDDIISQFIRTADAKALDTACMGRVHRPPFPTAFPGGKVVRIDPAALRRFTGRYAGPVPAEIRLQRDELHAFVGGEDLLLLPMGPTRFRLATSPHVQVEFREKGGGVTAFEVADGGAPVETFVRARSAARRTPAR